MQACLKPVLQRNVPSGPKLVVTPPLGLPWYALQIRQTSRLACEQMLAAVGVEFFSPCRTSTRQWSDRVRRAERPLFPGYLFCRFDYQRRLPVLQVPGVLAIVGAGRFPHPVEDVELAAVRRIVEAQIPAEEVTHLAAGQRVRMICGPLVGLEGVFERRSGVARLLLSITLLNRSVAVQVSPSQVEPA